MLFPSLILPLLLPAQGGPLPRTFQVVHCDQQEYTPANWSQLADFIAEASARQVKVSLEFGSAWADAVIADPNKQAEVAAWLAAGHALGAHHHDVTHPYWDGFTDLEPGSFTPPPTADPYRGTMADFKALMDRMADLVGIPGGRVRFGGLDDSIVYEEPYGMPWGTDGCRAVGCAVSLPYFRVVNSYGVWFIDHAYLGAFDPAQLSALKGLYLATSAPSTFGFTFHVQDYADDRAQYLDWLDFLQALDPAGLSRFTVPEILAGEPAPFLGSAESVSVATGGRIDFQAATDPTLAGHEYWILMGWSGTEPGYDLGGPLVDDQVHLGLNPDGLTDWVLAGGNSMLAGFSGVLDPAGAATAVLDTGGPLPAGYAGRQVAFVLVARDPAGGRFSFSSLPWLVDLLP
ncbi:MAG: hypothetical protein D6702_00775 [Planctomycetota bacterium]|nr:MAG: hypothetical protein D6702_00775 [Planctomycetota bacterium]